MKRYAPKLDLFKAFVAVVLVCIWIWLLSVYGMEIEGGSSQKKATLERTRTQEAISAPGEEPQLDLPAFPHTPLALRFDNASNMLVADSGQAHFELNVAGDGWIPLVPQEIRDAVGEGYSLGVDESGIWHISNADGAQYTFDLNRLEWMPVSVQGADGDVETEGAQDSQPPSASGIYACEGANPVRIAGVGAKVVVVNALIPLRSSPEALGENIIRPLPMGTPLEVTSFPVCTPYLGGANQWWGVRTADGQSGWAAEASALSPIYYLQELD